MIKKRTKYNIWYTTFETNERIKRIYKLQFDLLCFVIILITFILVAIGCFALYSAFNANIHPWAYKQMITWITLFLILFFIYIVSNNFLYSSTYYVYFFCLVLIILAEVIGHTAMGAHRWLHIGPINIQPSEWMKVAIIMVLARYFDKITCEEIKKIKFMLYPLILISIPVIFILKQPNLGTATIIILISGLMFFITGVSKYKFIFVLIVTLLVTPVIWKYGLHDYQKQRIMTFINSKPDALSSGYNISQSKIAIGSGLLFGKGALKNTQSKLNFLPEKHTDFIFSILAEEFGFLGVLFILMLYFILITSCYLVAIGAKNHYNRLLAFGAASLLFIHIAINISMISGIIPVVGTPLPFLSYGGSNLSTSFICIGLVMNVRANSL